jgi:hypothetical protein
MKTLVAICSQKDILRNKKVLKSKSYLRFSIAIIPPKIEENVASLLLYMLSSR